MSTQHEDTGTGWPQPDEPPSPAVPPDPRPDAPPADGVPPGPDRAAEPAVDRPPAEPEPAGGGAADDAGPGPAGSAEVVPPQDEATVRLDRSDTDVSGPHDEETVRLGPPTAGALPARDQSVRDWPADATGGPPAGDAPGSGRDRAGPHRPSAAGVMIVVLLALLGFTLVVQLKNNSTDPALGATRQEDLVRILSDLEAQQQRLQQDVTELEDSQRQLTSGAEGRQAALEEATQRADELGLLAGTLPARGPGLSVRFVPGDEPIEASALLDAVQELRGAGAEAMEITGGDGPAVRIIASTYFVDSDGGVDVSGRRLSGPYTISVIGDPETMRTALNIAGGVVARVKGDGGNVIVNEREVIDIEARSNAPDLKYARPVS
ncbi:DUF881 domain-containing protein [Plantactinospora sp. GCM10030261]|uniref:DUF881 domain-containing protein n=1 Tax=Plantactinospora sp. GCM10030261 TaxID=3273420 RepID=UPI0036114C56